VEIWANPSGASRSLKLTHFDLIARSHEPIKNFGKVDFGRRLLASP